MNKLLFLIFIFFGIISCQQTFIKIPKKNVDKVKVVEFEKFVVSYFNTLKNEKIYDFKNIANQEFNDKMTADTQKQTYKTIINEFGEFKSLKFNGIWEKEGNNDLQIIRYKGQFNKSNKSIEIRVVIDSTNKITGFWVKRWRDNLNSWIN